MSSLLQIIYFHRLYAVAALVALLAALLVTPLVRRLALRLDIVDRPDRHRKLHPVPTPLGGGLAVLGAFLVSLAVVLALSRSQQAALLGDLPFLLGLTASALLLCTVGLLDDRFGMRGRQKLLGQVVAATVLMSSGLVIERISVVGIDLPLEWLAVPFTLFWLLGAINALNLIDGMDGLATSVGIVLSLAIAAMAMLTGHRTEAFLALSMAGALAGFLVYNSPPASIFLGDAGSMLVGLVLGALAIRGSLKGPATAALAAPAAIWAIPALDVAVAILRRKLTGRSIYTTDRGHLHHVLQRRGLSNRWTVLAVGSLCAVTAVASVVSVYLHSELVACGAVAAVVGTLVVTGLFGRAESLLLVRRTKSFLLSLVPRLSDTAAGGQMTETHLQGNGRWEELWKTLTEFAERFDLSAVQLSVSLPAANEDYHASWQRREAPEPAELWRSEIPLVAQDRTVGRLSITGRCSNGSVCTWMGDLITGLKPFEIQMLELIDQVSNGSDQSSEAPVTSTPTRPPS